MQGTRACVFVFIMFSGQPHTVTVWSIPYSFGPDSSVEPGVSAYIWSSCLLHGKFLDFSECLRGMLLETHSMGVDIVNVDSILSGHHLVDGGLGLLGALLCGSQPARPGLESNNFHFKSRSFEVVCYAGAETWYRK